MTEYKYKVKLRDHQGQPLSNEPFDCVIYVISKGTRKPSEQAIMAAAVRTLWPLSTIRLLEEAIIEKDTV